MSQKKKQACPMCKMYGRPGWMLNAHAWVRCHLSLKGKCPDAENFGKWCPVDASSPVGRGH